MSKKMDGKILALFDSMRNAITDNNSIFDVIRAAELIIAESICQMELSERNEKLTFQIITVEIQEYTKKLRKTIEDYDRKTVRDIPQGTREEGL